MSSEAPASLPRLPCPRGCPRSGRRALRSPSWSRRCGNRRRRSALPEALHLDLRKIARAGRLPDLAKNVTLEEAGIAIVVVHALVRVCETGLVDHAQGLREREHADELALLAQRFGEDEG